MDSYRGAVVMSRSLHTSLPADVRAQFDKALKDADIATPVTLHDFCTPDNSQCVE